MNTRKQAFDSAMREIRKSGMNARRNVQGCCRSCLGGVLPNDKPIVWHYGGQGNSFTWREDKPVYTYTPSWDDEAILESIYLNHSGLIAESGEITEAGQLVLDTFQKHGYEVKWDGSKTTCLEVMF